MRRKSGNLPISIRKDVRTQFNPIDGRGVYVDFDFDMKSLIRAFRQFARWNKERKKILDILNKLSNIYATILVICRNNKGEVISKLPELEVHLTSREDELKDIRMLISKIDQKTFGFVVPGEIDAGFYIIHVSLDYLVAEIIAKGKDFREALESLILHEAQHIVDLRSKKLLAYNQAAKRMISQRHDFPPERKMVVKGKQVGDRTYRVTKLGTAKEFFWQERYFIMDYFDLMLLEGKAMFSGAFGSFNFGIKEFELYYNNAKQVCEQLAKMFENRTLKIEHASQGVRGYLEARNKPNPYYALTYNVGFHLVYTIVFAPFQPRFTFEHFQNLKHFELIRTYEMAIQLINKKHKLSLKPLISGTSNQGLIDYGRLLQQLWVLGQQVGAEKRLES